MSDEFPEFFDGVGRIGYAGPDTDDPLAFRWYDAERVVRGRTLRDHLRVAVCYWHSFNWDGFDIFGEGTLDRPWLDRDGDPMKAAEHKMAAAFEFMDKLGAPFWTFHDFDIAPEGATFAESAANLDAMVDRAAAHQERTGVALLWGTAKLFASRRYMAGAATNPDPEVFAYAAAQVAHCLEVTHRLGGHNYVLWGGREYDHDTAAVWAFLQRYDLADEIKVNIEVNHATLAGYDFAHEIAVAFNAGIFGSVDANAGDDRLGWDLDRFPMSVEVMAVAMLELLRGGGFTTGGFNFDAKLRRQSIARDDLFRAHIAGIDTLARSLIVAHSIIEHGELDAFRRDRYVGWDGDFGKQLLAGEHSLADLRTRANTAAEPRPTSGRQEHLESIVNRHLVTAR
jgi:xylose isomerase